MTTKKRDLAYALGISRQMVHKLARAGMPTHSAEAAHRWRAEHLDPLRRKDPPRRAPEPWRAGFHAGARWALCEAVPAAWFGEPGWLAAALREVLGKRAEAITAGELVSLQGYLLLIFMHAAGEVLRDSEPLFYVPLILDGSELAPDVAAKLAAILAGEAR